MEPNTPDSTNVRPIRPALTVSPYHNYHQTINKSYTGKFTKIYNGLLYGIARDRDIYGKVIARERS